MTPDRVKLGPRIWARSETRRASRCPQLAFIGFTLTLAAALTQASSRDVETIQVNSSLSEKDSTTLATTIQEVTSRMLLDTTTTTQASSTTQKKQTQENQAKSSSSEGVEASLGDPLKLKPSIQEVASELGRKHLSLASENWRLKQAQPTVASVTTLDSFKTLYATSSITSNGGVRQAERDIELSSTTRRADTEILRPSEVKTDIPTSTNFSTNEAEESFFHSDVKLEMNSQSNANVSQASKARSGNKYHSTSSRRRQKMIQLKGGQVEDEEESDLNQCRQYLRIHSPDTLLANSEWNRLAVHQQLPCTCDSREHFSDLPDSGSRHESIWLNCDHVQLIGAMSSSFSSMDSSVENSAEQSNTTTRADDLRLIKLTRFSQRDSGLQKVNPQKFLELKLFNLQSIDLSNNNIRQIKSDAFHGFETKLEFLNLANNLLGDFRAAFDESHSSPTNDSNGETNPPIFFTDELSRLKKLRWLSLRNNQISLLAANIFTKAIDQSTSDLIYLDLSENLLRSVPSESLRHLLRLERLSLSRNRITSLDQSSKFPKSIKYLDLSENSIKVIQYCDLIDLPNLIELNLSHNQLSYLDKTAFASSSKHHSLLGGLLMPFSSANLNTDEENLAGKTLFGSISRPRRSLTQLEGFHDSMASPEEEIAVETDDLEAEESIMSIESNSLRSSTEGSAPIVAQFNSTVALNLSFNFFELIPGDLLLSFPNLQKLDLSHNRIRQLDTSYLCSTYNLVEGLKYLDFSGNLMQVAQQNTSTLYRRDDEASRVGRLDAQVPLEKLFGCLQKLETVILSTNRLTRAAISASLPPTQDARNDRKIDSSDAFEEFDDLDISDSNQVTTALAQEVRLTFKIGENHGGKNIHHLDLSDNQLKHVPIISVDQTLNQVHSASDSHENSSHLMGPSNHLENLSLDFNLIERLDERDFEHITNLNQLHLNFNRITHLPPSVARKFTNLAVLDIEGNLISVLDPLDELFTQSARSLKVLNLANNRISNWPSLTKRSSGESIEGASQSHHVLIFGLEYLNLSGNLLSTGNVTSLFDQLSYMSSLRVLNLSYNLLNRVKSEWFKFANENIRHLLLSGNRINSIDLGSFAPQQVSELLELDLEFNVLKELKRKTFDSLPKIQEINLAHNLIHTINSETFHQLNNLRTLKLNHNKLTSWKCEYFSNLCNSISGNINVDLATLVNSAHLIKNEAQPVTWSASSLRELDLSHNSLSQLRTNSIAVHTKLVRLNLEHNKLSFIPHDLFKATISASTTGRQIQLISSLKYLNLAHNRIQMIDNINFKPLRNLYDLDLSFNEIQTLGTDVARDTTLDRRQVQGTQSRAFVKLNTNEDDATPLHSDHDDPRTQASQSDTRWPSLEKLRFLNFAFNQLTSVNQSVLNELNPFSMLNLNLSHNFLDSESLPVRFLTKISPQVSYLHKPNAESTQSRRSNPDLIFNLKLESLDLSHNRISEVPVNLLENHYSTLDSCDLSHNRIQNVPSNSNPLIQVRSLNLEFNPLSRESSEFILLERRNVRSLNLAATRLYAIQQVSIAADQLVASGLPLGQQQSLSDNQTSQLDLIRSISKPIEAPYLRSLNLSSNQLVWLSSNIFARMNSLQVLDLSNNRLTRLNLLNAPLARVKLEYLDLRSNFFTAIHSSDLSQLTTLRYLDLSNLLNLSKFNCRFLSKFTTLRKLRMFNYPLLRQTLAASRLALSLTDPRMPERFRQKFLDDLIGSSIGRHCFSPSREEQSIPSDEIMSVSNDKYHLKPQSWFNLEDLEVELFGNGDLSSNSFALNDELTQLIGPKLNKLTIFGLNITSISDDSLLGVTNDLLDLRISYTSMMQLPLQQIVDSISKRTRVNLDFRNNLITSIDSRSLLSLEELVQRGVIGHTSGDLTRTGGLKLTSNPIRCDCQARPLWLWLNQHWTNSNPWQIWNISNSNTSISLEDTQNQTFAADMSILNPGNANYWLRFNTPSQSSDLKCYFPTRLRGKPTQHVNYNDLLCKEPTQTDGTTIVSRQARKKNETFYPGADLSYDFEENEEDTYLSTMRAQNPEVQLTKFNRYPTNLVANDSSIYLPMQLEQSEISPNRDDMDLDRGASSVSRIGKQDQSSLSDGSNPDLPTAQVAQQEFSDSITPGNMRRYNRHKPNINQRHLNIDSLNAFSSIPIGPRSPIRTNGKYQWLTDSDILILTITGSAITVMSFIIMGICFLKYKLDQSGNEMILARDTQSKFAIAFPQNLCEPMVLKASQALKSKKRGPKKGSGGASDNSSSPPRSKSSRKGSSTSSSSCSDSANQNLNPQKASGSRRQAFVPLVGTQQVLVPVGQNCAILANATQNFLMRSPTIRRMQGLANNTSDWFNYTLKAYPALSTDAANRPRRRLFIGGQQQISLKPQTSTSATTVRPAQSSRDHQGPQRSNVLPPSLAAGCPLHSFMALQALKEASDDPKMKLNETDCTYCNHLLTAARQTRVQIAMPTSSREVINNNQPADKKRGDEYHDAKTENLLRSEISSIQKGEPEHFETRKDMTYQSRNSYQKPTMKTFVSNPNHNKEEPRKSVVRSGEDDRRTHESQLPTIGVDGRFTYQTESQIESPSCRTESILSGLTQGTRGEASSVLTTSDHEDIFILMPDSRRHSYDHSTSECPNVIEILPGDHLSSVRELDGSIHGFGDLILDQGGENDSSTSSPVAYGLNISSPSVETTIFSNIMTSLEARPNGPTFNPRHQENLGDNDPKAPSDQEDQLISRL